MKETGRTWPIRIPPTPDAFAIALISNDKMVQGRVVQLKLPPRAQCFDRPNENEIGRARTETRRGRRRQKEKFAGFKMSRGLEADFGEV